MAEGEDWIRIKLEEAKYGHLEFEAEYEA